MPPYLLARGGREVGARVLLPHRVAYRLDGLARRVSTLVAPCLDRLGDPQPNEADVVASLRGLLLRLLALAGDDPTSVERCRAVFSDSLTDPTAVGRIKACEECRWTFLDTTRNGRRRYCDPADCGNRARQRRHAQRRSG